jgi:CubicO group peptidase (beta-lactamase class C family)
MPTPGASSSGGHFSARTVGHLGYTGTSFWSDLERGISVILLTNRVHPYAENDDIRTFRPAVHDAAMTCLAAAEQ